MRNIICTSLLLALTTIPAVAEPLGCFSRDYDAAHLTANPKQVVANMRLDMHLATGNEGMLVQPGQTIAFLSVILADQGHVAITPAPDEGYPEGFGGVEMYNAFACSEQEGATTCVDECGTGGFEIMRVDSTKLYLNTTKLWVGMGQDCGGFTDLAELPGQSVTYLLHRVDDALCTEY